MNDNTPLAGATQKPKRSWIPLCFFAFFGVVLAANSTMVYVALSSWTGLETKNHYIKGVDYNDTLDTVAAQNALGWHVDETLKAVGTDGRYHVTFAITDQNGTPLTGAEVKAVFERPTHHGYDENLILKEFNPGEYSGVVSLPLDGLWRIRHLVWHGTDTYQGITRHELYADNS